MRRIKIFQILAFVLAGFIFCIYSAEAACPGEIGSADPIPSTWTKECSPYVIKNSILANDPVIFEPGVIVKFKNAASATFNNSVTAIGTEKEKIIFTAYTDDEHGGDTDNDLGATHPKAGYWYRILIGSNSAAQFENTLFLYGGEHPWGTLSLQPNAKNSVSVKNSTFKYNQYAGIYINYNPDQIIQNNNFLNNGEGIVLNDCYYNATATISGNSFENNINFGARVAYPNINTLDARNNWWGDWTGPTHKNNPGGKGDKVSNGVIFDPWIGKDGPDPVVIIPGIMGSWKNNGKWQIDPIFHTYDNLYQEFLNNNYIPDYNLFTFPYEWRDSNKVNAVELHTKIQDIKRFRGRPKVDIVAHSMGGLLAREYIESRYYDNDVDQLITVGTPQLGAPKDYLMWEGGEAGPTFSDFILKKIFQQEAEENGFDNLFQYIQQRPLTSVQELLPAYNYLYDAENGYALRETYPNLYPQNVFLDKLNNGDANHNPENLKNVEFTKIIGNLSGNESTISGFNVTKGNVNGMWTDGYPENYWLITGNRGIRRGVGDGTVPLYSAESLEIPSNKTIPLPSEHSQLPTVAKSEILKILTGSIPKDVVNDIHIPNILLVLVHSPVDIQIEDSQGRMVGKNIKTNETNVPIPNAFYSTDEKETCENDPEKFCNARGEFITIPNPTGEYNIITQGTDNGGAYEIEIAKINEGETNLDVVKEAEAVITGTAISGEVEEQGIDVEENKITIIPKDATPPAITEITSSNPDGFYKAGDKIDIQISFSELVTAQSVMLTLNTNQTCQFSLEDSQTTACEYTVQEGDNSPDLNVANISGEIKDQAGNVLTDYIPQKNLAENKDIAIDTTPPTITGFVTSQPNSNGWYNADIAVHFDATDEGSGIRSVTPDATISTEGEKQSAAGNAFDNAGNEAAFTVSGINIDKTAPEIAINSPQEMVYMNNETIIPNYQIKDNLISEENVISQLYLNGASLKEENIDLFLMYLGEHSFKIAVSDRADNYREKEIKFTSKTNIDAIDSNIDHYFNLNLIKTKYEKLYLEIRIAQIKELYNWLAQVQNSSIGPLVKKILVSGIKNTIRFNINQLVYHINSVTPSLIDQQASDLLKESLQTLI